MNFIVRWEPEAEADYERIRQFDPMLASFVLDHLDRLLANLHGLRQPPSFPHLLLPKYEVYTDDARHRITFLFQFGSDEQSLHLIYVGWVDYGLPADDE